MSYPFRITHFALVNLTYFLDHPVLVSNKSIQEELNSQSVVICFPSMFYFLADDVVLDLDNVA